MKRSLRAVLCAVVSCGAAIVTWPDPVRGQAAQPGAPAADSAAPAPLPPGTPPPPANAAALQPLKTANNLNPQQKQAISAFVAGQVAALAAGGPNATAARDVLVNESMIGGRPESASPTYLDEYANQINAHVGAALPKMNLPARLNAAIAVQRVAEQAKSSQLRQVATQLLQDKEQPVVLWGMRAAKSIVPPVVRNPVLANDVVLRQAVPAAVKAQTTGVLAGDIAREAYDTLTLNFVDPKVRPTITVPMIKGVIKHLHDLLRVRVDQFRLGIPPMPLVDRTGINFLWDSGVWAAQDEGQRLQTAQLYTDLLSLAGQQAQAGKAAEATPVVQAVAAAISILGTNANAADVTQSAQALAQLKGPNPQQLQEGVDAVVAAMQKSFPKLNAPPKVNPPAAPAGAAPGAAPATAATGPVPNVAATAPAGSAPAAPSAGTAPR